MRETTPLYWHEALTFSFKQESTTILEVICLLPHVSTATAQMVRKQLLFRSPEVTTTSQTTLAHRMQQPLQSSPLLTEAMQRNKWFQQQETH
ncbi:hypothetical protein BRARA_B03197 [Brassica rapa]|uniref:Uncharacterized protein n=1 Tax=Brassica campestris TaxID=3711 RepID=A0A398ALH9_BRACM|nr:hypothetical protein BRARA_B03197 [Brassica rapa]